MNPLERAYYMLHAIERGHTFSFVDWFEYMSQIEETLGHETTHTLRNKVDTLIAAKRTRRTPATGG